MIIKKRISTSSINSESSTNFSISNSDISMLKYYVDFTRVIDRRLKMGVADGRVEADGEIIYQVTDMKVGLALAATD